MYHTCCSYLHCDSKGTSWILTHSQTTEKAADVSRAHISVSPVDESRATPISKFRSRLAGFLRRKYRIHPRSDIFTTPLLHKFYFLHNAGVENLLWVMAEEGFLSQKRKHYLVLDSVCSLPICDAV
jgi:hypothetical protein